MSGIYITPEESLKLYLCRYYNISGEITLANHRLAAGLTSGEMLVDVTLDGMTWTVGYNRLDINSILGSYSLVRNELIFETLPTHEEVIAHLNDALGLQLAGDTFVERVTVAGVIVLTVKPDNPYLKGSIVLSVVDGSNITYPKPDNEWLLNSKTENTGKNNTPFAPVVEFADFANKTWATFTGSGFQQFGTPLSTAGDWTIDYELYYKSIGSYEHIMSGPEAAGNQTGAFKMHGGRVYEAYCSQSASPEAMSINTPTRHTYVCLNGIISFYQNGKLQCTWPTTNPATRPAITGLRSAYGNEGQMASRVAYFRAFRYFSSALTDTELTGLFEDNGVPKDTPPKYHWPLDGNLNAAIGDTPLLDGAFDWISHRGKTWGYHKSNRVSDLGVALPVGKDCTFQFTMTLIKQPASMWCGLFGNTGTSTTNDPARIKITSDTWTGTEKPVGYRPYAGLNAPKWMLSPQLNFGIGVTSVITMRRSGRTIDMYKDGVKYMTFDADPHDSAITKVGASKEWMTDGVLIRDIKYWDYAINTVPVPEFEYVPPVHQWLLDGKDVNTGTDPAATRWKPGITYVTHNSTPMAKLQYAGKTPFAIPLDLNADWSLSMKIVVPNLNHRGLFTSDSTVSHGVATMIYQSRLTVNLNGGYANLWQATDPNVLMKANTLQTIAMTKEGKSYKMYVDGVLVQTVDTTVNITDRFTQFGTYNGGTLLDTSTLFGDVRFYDYALPPALVKDIATGKR